MRPEIEDRQSPRGLCRRWQMDPFSGAVLVILCFALLILLFGMFQLVRVERGPETARITVSFLLPVDPMVIERNLKWEMEYPDMDFDYQLTWHGPFKLEILYRENGLPRGGRATLKLQPVTVPFPFTFKELKINLRLPAPPALLRLVPGEDGAAAGYNKLVPTSGPLVLEFNTPLEENHFHRFVAVYPSPQPGGGSYPGSFTPATVSRNGYLQEDTSRWVFTPELPFENDKIYTVVLRPGLKARSGAVLTRQVKMPFKTASPLLAVETSPRDGETEVSLFRTLEVSFDREIKKGSWRIPGLEGIARVERNRLIFEPKREFMPGTTYEARAQGVALDGEPGFHTFSFETRDMGDRLWVVVDLHGPNQVRVYKGKGLIRSMIASGGKPGHETPTGTYEVEARGYSFFNPKYQEGAYYWVRFKGPYLFHSLPFGPSGEISKKAELLLGCPASHGCIRLTLSDAKWMHDNLPTGTMVIIYR